MNVRRFVAGPIAGALLLTLCALPALAQAGGSGWTPFVGCWEPMDAGGEAGLLCFRPEGQGVEMFNVVDGRVVSTERVAADGVRRPVSAEGCSGVESAEFSLDELRIFTRSDFECGQEARAGSGVMSFIAPTQWVDVRSLGIEGEPVAWVQRYGLADAEALAAQGIEDPASFDRALVRAMRTRAAQDIDVGDVEEAAERIDARAVEVWVATHETRFELSGGDLVRLADAGVPESVIDVMIAVSYPDRFVVSPERAEAASERGGEGVYRTGYRRGFRTYLFDPFYRPFGFGYSGYYSPFGYYGYGLGGYYGGFSGGYYGYRPAPIVVTPRSGGRIEPGRGYTRASTAGGSGSRGTARPRSSSGGSASGSSGGGGAAASRGGSQSGASGGSGRTARPRR